MGEETTEWGPDILPGFLQASIPPVTLVRPTAQPKVPRAAVLHIHGYNDYFFQSHLARAFTDAGYAFYAVDLPRAGRSLAPDDVPHFMADASEQGDGIDVAVGTIATRHPGLPLVLHGHSTGGLTAAIWAADRPHPALAALILDSPLLGTRMTWANRARLKLLPVIAALKPLAVVASAPSVYAQRQHVSGGGRWDFDFALKRPQGVPVRAAWLAAAQRARRRVARGLGLTNPVLVARSDSSGPDSPDNSLLDRQDTVLSVDQISALAARFGDDVEELVIAGGVHELSLSQDEPRELYLRSITRWLDSVLP
jgi:alpha-beta hydrolase superfamily lysophospholipase